MQQPSHGKHNSTQLMHGVKLFRQFICKVEDDFLKNNGLKKSGMELIFDENKCFIKGKTDTVLGFDDKTYGVVDFKTTSVKEANIIN